MESNGSNIVKETTGSGVSTKAGIVVVLVLAVAGALYMKGQKPASPSSSGETVLAAKADSTSAPAAAAGLPRLVDLGAGKCIPCKMMAPILEELKKTCAGKLDVVFIDVWEKPDEAEKYGINLIPTQVFYDAAGKELFRHEGFFSREDILAKWKELGVDLSGDADANAHKERT